MTSANIELIVGLGNPGKQYANTRHNAGCWFVKCLVAQHDCNLAQETKFHALLCQTSLYGKTCRIAIPTTYMNESGSAVSALLKFYKIEPSALLIAHDEIDLPPGVSRLKTGGGHGGHNGLRDIIDRIGTKDFHRLRIGVGHPGSKDRVHDYVLSKASQREQSLIDNSIDDALKVIENVVIGKVGDAMTTLHTGEG